MNTFVELINHFNKATASHNEILLYEAVCALVTIVERQGADLKRLKNVSNLCF